MGLRRNASYEEQLQKEFGLQYGNEGWVFKGYELPNPAPDLNFPGLWLLSLLEFQKRMPFTKICIIADIKPMACIFNTQPFPCAINISFSLEQVAELMAEIAIKGNPAPIVYGDIFVVTLS